MTQQDAISEALAWAKTRYGPQVRPLRRGSQYDAERLSLGHYWCEAVSRWEVGIAYRARGGHEQRVLVEVIEYARGDVWVQAVGRLGRRVVVSWDAIVMAPGETTKTE